MKDRKITKKSFLCVFVLFAATLHFLATDDADDTEFESWCAFLPLSIPIREIRS
jgi:hypothetical protein